MYKNNERKMTKNVGLRFFSNLIEQFEFVSIESNFIKLFLIFTYVVFPNTYLYHFLAKSNPSDFFISFNYYLNPVAILESFESQTVVNCFLIFFFIINISILLYYTLAIFLNNKNVKIELYFKACNYLSDLYVWIFFAPSIEIFLKSLANEGFETDLSICYYIISLIGIMLSFFIGIVIIYLSQDHIFLSDSKIRLNISASLIFSFLFRLIGIILMVTVPDSESIQFVCNYLIYISAIYYYLSELPFKDRKISIFYFWMLIYSLSNTFILTLNSLEIMIVIDDLLIINLVILFLTFLLSYSVYNKHYLSNFFEGFKIKKTSTKLFEDLACLNESAFEEKKSNLLILGFLKIHFYNENEKLIRSQINNPSLLKKRLLTEYIYSNFLELLNNRECKLNVIPSETTYLKFFTFLLRFGFNPIRNFYEMQKISNRTQDFSFYFKAYRNLIVKEMKKKITFYLNFNQPQSNVSSNKQKYEEFIKIMSIKEKLEADFKCLIAQKIEYLEKHMEGDRNLHTMFSSNIRFAPKLHRFKNKLKFINGNSSYLKIIKLRLQSLLYSWILNNYAKASLLEKKFRELHRAKNDNYNQKDPNLDFFAPDTVVCEASFLKNNGEILETCINSKLLRFFGFEPHENDKMKHINDLLPLFFRNYHDKRMKCYVNQNEGLKRTETLGYAVDKSGFIFPIFTMISLNYSKVEDFVLIAGITKIHDQNKKFCLCDMEGNMLNISKELFEDFKKEFDDLKLEDLNKINLFNQMPTFSLDDYDLESLGAIKEIKTLLIFPDSFSDFSFNPKNRQKTRTLTSKTSIRNEKTDNKMVEVSFDVILKKSKCEGEIFNYLVIKISHYNQIKQKSSHQNLDHPFIKEIKFSNFKKESKPILANDQKKINNFQPKKDAHNEILLIHLDEKNSNKQSISSYDMKARVTMLSTIRSIKQLNPRSLKLITIALFVQVLLILLFAGLTGNKTKSYHKDTFEPSQEAFLSFSEFFHLNGILLSSNIQLEYDYLGLTSLSQSNFKYIADIYEHSLIESQAIAKGYRNSDQSDLSLIHHYLLNSNITYYDVFSKSLKSDGNMDFIDKLFENMRSIFDTVLNREKSVTYEDLIFLSRNYPKYLSIMIPIFSSMQGEFSNLNFDFKQNILIFLIVFGALTVLFKIIEIYFWFGFVKGLENLIKVFLRMTESEINESLNALKQFSLLMAEKSDKYYQFALEEYLHRDKENDKESIPNYKPKGSGKRKNMISIKKLPKTPFFIYIGLCSLVLGCFFGFNYYSWISVSKFNQKISDLDLVYASTYASSSSIVYMEELLLREKIVDNNEFEIRSDYFNSKQGRLALLLSNIQRMMTLFADSLSVEALFIDIKNGEESGEIARQILNGNLCEVLLNSNVILNKNTTHCEKLLNGAFLKGVGNVLVELIKNIKSRASSMHNLTTDMLVYAQQVRSIRGYIRSPDYFEAFLSNYYFHEILEIYYDFKINSYSEALEKEEDKFNASLSISVVFVALINFITIQVIFTKIRSVYKSNTIVLSMISYDRILNDSQVLPILRQILKENS